MRSIEETLGRAQNEVKTVGNVILIVIWKHKKSFHRGPGPSLCGDDHIGPIKRTITLA